MISLLRAMGLFSKDCDAEVVKGKLETFGLE